MHKILTNFFIGINETNNIDKEIFPDLNLDNKTNGDCIDTIIKETKKFEQLLKTDEEFKLSEKMNFDKFSYSLGINKEKLKNFIYELKKKKHYIAVKGLFNLEENDVIEEEIPNNKQSKTNTIIKTERKEFNKPNDPHNNNNNEVSKNMYSLYSEIKSESKL